MASTYSNIKIQLMATGENTTTWGDVTNVNLGTAIEEAIVGSADVAFSNANVTLTLTDTNSTQAARNMRLNLTGTATSGYNLVVPAIEKPYIVNNGTDGTITVKNATGTGIAVPAGKTMWVYNNGTNVVDAVTHLTSLTLGTPLPVAQGGTGGNTAADARTALDVPSRTGANASGTWAINVSGSAATATSATTASTANALNVSNSYTVAELNSNGIVYASTPNAGTSGGFVLKGNATSGNAIIQVRDSTATSQWGYAVVTSAGGFAWSGAMTATSFSGAGTGLTGTASSLTVGNATNATNAANLVTANYSIVQASGYIYIKYGSTNICRIDSSGNAVFAGNVTAYGSI